MNGNAVDGASVPSSDQTGAFGSFTVVVCAYTEERLTLLEAAIQSVQQQSHPVRQLILVVDHSPALFAKAMATFGANVEVVANTHRKGLAGARNSGLALALGEIVAFLDDDAQAPIGWLAGLLGGYDSSDVAGVGGSVSPIWPDPGRPSWFPSSFDWVVGCSYSGLPTKPAVVRNPLGANMSFRRALLEEIGGFDEALGRKGRRPLGCEETELAIRLRQTHRDALVLYLPEIEVIHSVSVERTRISYFMRRCFFEGRSKAAIVARVGVADGLAAERTFIARNCSSTRMSDAPTGAGAPPSAQQVLASAAGIAAAGVGFVAGLVAEAPGLSARSGRGETGHWARGPDRAKPHVSNRRLNVAMVAPEALPGSGGIATHISEVAERLTNLGVEVTVATTGDVDCPAQCERQGVAILTFPRWRYPKDGFVSPLLLAELRQGGHDLVHVQGVHTLLAPAALLVGQRIGLPTVLSLHTGGHSSFVRHKLRPLQWAILTPVLRRTTAIVAVSEHEMKVFGRYLGQHRSKITLIPNGVAAREPRFMFEQPFEGSPLLVSVGRLERYKGHHKVIAALPAILGTAPEARLVIAGSGPYEMQLRRLARRLGVADRVSIKSYRDEQRPQLLALIASADVVTLLSTYEGHPLAVLEAIGLGRPIVVADSPGLTEIAEQGLAVMVPGRATADDTARCILGALSSMGRRASAVPPLPTWDDCARDLAEVYRRVVACGS
jgi:glycosyltransferase involved in cell wall biosynthesis/GT2 family glycosyltransferase